MDPRTTTPQGGTGSKPTVQVTGFHGPVPFTLGGLLPTPPSGSPLQAAGGFVTGVSAGRQGEVNINPLAALFLAPERVGGILPNSLFPESPAFKATRVQTYEAVWMKSRPKLPGYDTLTRVRITVTELRGQPPPAINQTLSRFAGRTLFYAAVVATAAQLAESIEKNATTSTAGQGTLATQYLSEQQLTGEHLSNVIAVQQFAEKALANVRSPEVLSEIARIYSLSATNPTSFAPLRESIPAALRVEFSPLVRTAEQDEARIALAAYAQTAALLANQYQASQQAAQQAAQQAVIAQAGAALLATPGAVQRLDTLLRIGITPFALVRQGVLLTSEPLPPKLLQQFDP